MNEQGPKGTTRIKICGLRRHEDIMWANEFLPDYIGFVFAPKSRRCVDPEQARLLKSALSPAIKAVGVFVDAEIDFIAEIASAAIIDMVQLHGHEDNCYIANLRKKVNAPVLQAFTIAGADDVRRAESSDADIILLDNGNGGSGETFDWQLVRSVSRPFILAGGLTPDNVADAVSRCRPFGVDVSSGVETDGFKDRQKMEQFIKIVRRLNR